MTKMMAIPVGAVLALACLAFAHGHHSGSMYVTAPVWIEGTVVRFDAVNPHSIITLEQQSDDGQERRWAIEGPARAQLESAGIGSDAPSVGDVVRVCAFAYKPAAELSRLFPGVDFSSRAESDAAGAPQRVAGHVLVMPAGEKRLWEPHGFIAECIRSSDEQRQSWLDFLDSDPRARQAWCEQREYVHVRSTPALQELVEEIDGALGGRCR